MADWSRDAEKLVTVGMVLGIGFGIMGYVLYTFQTALGSTSAGGNWIGNVITAFNSSISTVLPAIITISFVVLLYVIVKKAGLLGGSGREK